MSGKRVLVIAGTDSSGGAGLTRDTATAAALGCEVLPVVTAVTAQTHSGVSGISPVSADFVRQQVLAALASGPVEAVKIGMLGSTEVADCLADLLDDCPAPVVMDPVLKSTSGGALMTGAIPAALLRRCDLMTPNLPEAAQLCGRQRARTREEIACQAQHILRAGARSVLIKGGHATDPEAIDHLFGAAGHHVFVAPRLGSSRRGTGCTLATAIACHLALGLDMPDACRAAKGYVHDWLGAGARA